MAQRQVAADNMPGNFVTELVEMPAWLPNAMERGYIFLLPNRIQLRMEHGFHSFWAVLACPRCGTLGLITEQQYPGQQSMICGQELCSCYSLIRDQSRFEYPPLH